MPKVVPPATDRDDEFFWTGVNDGALLVRKCAKCARLQHPPSPMCPKCGSVEWATETVSGRGNVVSWIVSKHPTGDDDAPRIVALIELDEGARLVSNLQGIEPAKVKNGMRVEVTIMVIDGVTLPQFRPAQEASR
jgi:uncharacterized OB-fold protein